MPQFAIDLENALFAFGRLTPFAWLAVLGALLTGLGVLSLLGVDELGADRSGGLPLMEETADFKERVAAIGFAEKSFYLFLAGVILLLIGVYPFVAAAAAAAG